MRNSLSTDVDVRRECSLLVLLLIYYALPVVCTSRYILLAKRSILTLRKYGKDVTLQSRPLGIDTVEVTQP